MNPYTHADVLRRAIMREYPDAVDVHIEPPEVLVLHKAGVVVRYWLPTKEFKEGDTLALRPVPPNMRENPPWEDWRDDDDEPLTFKRKTPCPTPSNPCCWMN